MHRVAVRPDPSALEERRLTPACEGFREWIAGLALGEPARPPDVLHARHARRCRACDAFADDLAACRRALLGGAARAASARADRAAEGDGAQVDAVSGVAARGGEARAVWDALALQLRARLARDLLARARREAGREADAVRADLERWRVVAQRAGRSAAMCERVARVLAAPAPGRARLLGLAWYLDPAGLDVALAWIGWLLHAGHRRRADDVADRLLRELPGFPG